MNTSLSPNPYLEKSSSLLAGASLVHVGQNLLTNDAIKRKTVAKYLADSFSNGVHGVVDTSLSSRATRSAMSAIVPDISAAHRMAHEAGYSLKEVLTHASKKQKLAARLLSEGRFDKLQRYGLDKDPVVQAVHQEAIRRKLPIPNPSSSNIKEVMDLWNDPSHPLLSNIAKNISRGHKPVGDHFKPGRMNQTNPLLSSAAAGIIDPVAGGMDAAKALANSDTFNKNKYGKMLVDKVQKIFITNPINHGLEAEAPVHGLGHQAYKYLGNPMSAHLKRTTAALKQAVEHHRE